jgi:hypothetical protein
MTRSTLRSTLQSPRERGCSTSSAPPEPSTTAGTVGARKWLDVLRPASEVLAQGAALKIISRTLRFDSQPMNPRTLIALPSGTTL